MIITKKIYNDEGRLISEVAACDCGPIWTWTDLIVGVLGAFIFFALTAN